MLNFPIPYQDELVYSTIARYGVHFGITSPKQLLEEVYANRKVIATTDLPNQLKAIAKHLVKNERYDTKYLSYKHTLFPLYASFVPEENRVKCLRLMTRSSSGAIHLALGVVASRVKQELLLRYCPQCLQIQEQDKGEYYWKRLWQVKGADCCLLHGQLIKSQIERHSHHRHEFIAPSPVNCPIVEQSSPSVASRVVTKQVENLLNRPESKSASFSKWTMFYKKLADSHGCSKGRFVDQAKIRHKVLNCWSQKWLEEHNLEVDNSANCWLKKIFRKHINSFSYLEHIVVLQAFSHASWNITEVLNEVSRTSDNEKKELTERSSINVNKGIKLKLQYQEEWAILVRKYGIKSARQKKPGGAIYAWLYKYNKSWFLTFNKQNRIRKKPINTRVNWPKRDKLVVRQLINLRNSYIGHLGQPQMTRNWYFSKIDSYATVEKNIGKMPLSRLFFVNYSESVTEYQMRRVTRVLIQLNIPMDELKRWKVLRLAGLSEKRLKKETKEFLTKIVGI